jgi:hypothetical protein
MAPLDLLDTPGRASLNTRSTTLRASIKNWERSFAADHDGKKPSKSDIKANADIAAKYKEFQRLGDVLAGRLELEALESPRRKRKADPVRRRLYDLTPPKSRENAVFDGHPSQIDPYDVPPSGTPKRFLNAIGPTPQRDGKVLGLFDLLSNSGGSRGSRNTPGSQDKKRKLDALSETQGNVVAQTPSRKKIATQGDILQHLAPATEINDSGSKKFGRTPASESKKFMLSHFFATPSTMRYANLVGDAEVVNVEKTPLRDLVLDIGSAEKRKDKSIDAQDTTPVFLRRTHSFKERLVSASARQAASSTGEQATSPSTMRRGPQGLRRYKSATKPLSQIVRDLMSVGERLQKSVEDNDDDDAMEAMREMENEDSLVPDSQYQELSDFEGQGESDLDDDKPASEKERTWKKKGQKRTTKRSNMKPAMVKKAKAPKFVVAEESEDEMSRVEETQFHSNADGAASSPYEDLTEDEFHALDDVETKELPQGEEDSENEFEPEDEEGGPEHVDIPVKKRRKAQPTADQDVPHAFKPKKSSRVATINPNAASHQNFRSLKIRGKGLKSKGAGAGRGKFGRKR